MASIQVKTNGQTLKVNASVSHWTTAALAETASGTNDVESSTTTTITSDYTMHFSNAATTAVITVTQPDGTTLLAQTFNVEPGTGPRVLNPLPDAFQAAADQGFDSSQLLTTGQETMPRTSIVSASIGMTSQLLRVAYFTARKTEAATSARVVVGSTAAAATPSLIKIVLYNADLAGALTSIVASTAHDAALLTTISTAYTKAFATPSTVTAGSRYALGLLVVTGATAPTVVGGTVVGGINGEAGQSPKLAGTVASQADIPASVVAGSVSDSNTMPYFVLLP